MSSDHVPAVHERRLFTPGPLNTSKRVKEAMLVDAGSRDSEFIATVDYVRKALLEVVHCQQSTQHTAVLVQGAGSFTVQAVFDNYIGNSDTKVLILGNGAYGERMQNMCELSGYNHVYKSFDWRNPLNLVEVETYLQSDGGAFGLVAVVHSETSTGMINDIHRLALLVQAHSKARFFVDCMSSLGAIDVNMADYPIDFCVSSANKCLQGVPGFAYVIARRDALAECQGRCRSWSTDLCAQDKAFTINGQFRCTPATHTILAFAVAIDEWREETREGREKRYRENNRIIREGMRKLGFRAYDVHLNDREKGFIITPFLFPNDAKFHFQKFYDGLNERGQVIYPGKVLGTECFRLGNIGDLHPEDCQRLMSHCEDVLTNVLHIQLPVNSVV